MTFLLQNFAVEIGGEATPIQQENTTTKIREHQYYNHSFSCYF
jgi:hypothetical protein